MERSGDRSACALFRGWEVRWGLGTWERRLLGLGLLVLLIALYAKCRKKRGRKGAQRERAPYVGLVNQGTTCYLNSVLQCLFFTPELRHTILRYDQAGRIGNLGESSLVTQLRGLFEALQTAQEPVSTTSVTRCLGLRNVHEQQDVLEFFHTLLTRMAAEQAELGQMFQLTTEQVIQCQVCKEETRLEEERLFLLVPVLGSPGGALSSVDEAVQALFREQQVTGDSQYYCVKCDRKTDAWSKLHLLKLPPVLVIILERFAFCHGAFQKLEDEVTLSATLSLPSPEQDSYELFAVCNHRGDLTGGHYTADIKPLEKPRWYRFSDCTVEELPHEPFESRTAYLLMYHRRGHSAPRCQR